MKKYIRNSRYIDYNGHKIKLEDGESKLDAIARYKASFTPPMKEVKPVEKIHKLAIKYKDGDIVMTKDGQLYYVFDPYILEDDVYYGALPVTLDGDRYLVDAENETEIQQSEIRKLSVKQRKQLI